MALITWNPTDMTSGSILSNNNFTVKLGGELASNRQDLVRATKGKSSGKWYWEVLCEGTIDLNMFVGVTTKNTLNWDSSQHRAYRPNGGKIAPTSAYGSFYTIGDIVGVALNLESESITFYKNGVSQGVAFTNLIEDEYYPFAQILSTPSRPMFTANFGATPFEYEVPEGYLPYDYENASWLNPRKFLLKSNISNSISTIDSSGLIIPTNLTEPLTRENFDELGFTDLNLLIGKDITEFELLISSPTVGVPIKIQTEAIPFPQLVLSKGDIVINPLKKIINFNLTVDSPILQNIKTIFSVNSGANWMTYSNTLGEFEEIDISDLTSVKNNGIDSDTFNLLGSKWNEVLTDNKIRFGYYLEIDDVNDIVKVDELSVLMDVYGKFMSVDSYKYAYGNRKLHVKLIEDGDYKINYME